MIAARHPCCIFRTLHSSEYFSIQFNSLFQFTQSNTICTVFQIIYVIIILHKNKYVFIWLFMMLFMLICMSCGTREGISGLPCSTLFVSMLINLLHYILYTMLHWCFIHHAHSITSTQCIICSMQYALEMLHAYLKSVVAGGSPSDIVLPADTSWKHIRQVENSLISWQQTSCIKDWLLVTPKNAILRHIWGIFRWQKINLWLRLSACFVSTLEN